jgi:hypothetical protein
MHISEFVSLFSATSFVIFGTQPSFPLTQARNATAATAAAAFASASNPDSLLLLRADDLWPLVFAPALNFTWVAVGMLGVLAVWVLILSCTVFRKHR